MTTYVWENITWQFHNGAPTIIIFARDIETKTLKKIAVKNFKPYYYVADAKGDLVNCYGDPIRKVICKTPLEVTAHKNSYKAQGIDTFESDIPCEMRYLYDKGIKYGFNEKLEPIETDLLPPRTCFYDIEVDIPKDEGIDEEKGRHPIVAIAVLDSYTQEGRVFTIGTEGQHSKQICCGDEKTLLNEFFNYIASTDPDIIAGWNSEDFDLPYIVNRARALGISTARLNRTDSEVNDRYTLVGRVHMDMLVFFKDWSKPMGQFPTYGLKYVSEHFAGFKYDAHGAEIQTLIAHGDWKTVVEYNLNDVLALQKIDTKAGLVAYHENLRRIVGIKYESTIKRTHIIESLLIRYGIKPIPCRRKHEQVDFEGAVVIQPTVGVKKQAISLDAKSLYPTIIIAFNLSPDIDGMIPKTIIFIANEREKYRKLKLEGKASESDEVTEQSLKYIANSFYGAMGSPMFKLYDPRIASFITEKGREINESIQALVKKEGYNVIGGDTDSVFINPVKSVEDGKRIEALVNEHLREWAAQFGVPKELAPTVKFEKYFESLFFKKRAGSDEAAKKKYVGWLRWKDGKEKDELSYTGIEIKRSDTAPFTKTCMESFFQKVLKEGKTQEAVDEVSVAFNKVRSGKVPVHDIAIPKGVKRTDQQTAHVKGMANGKEYLNIRFDRSKKPKLLYCKSPCPEICIDDNITQDEVTAKVTIDYDKMADRIVAQKMRSLVESLGYRWETVIGGQTTLEDLFGDE